METLRFSILIDADRKTVWDTMLNDATYRQWAKAFNESSYYEGKWEKGNEMRFLGRDENGDIGGMLSKIKECEKYRFVSIEHLGTISRGVVDTTSEEVKKWAHALENYTLTEKKGRTEVLVETDIDPEFRSMFEDMWPEALESLKQLCEQGQ